MQSHIHITSTQTHALPFTPPYSTGLEADEQRGDRPDSGRAAGESDAVGPGPGLRDRRVPGELLEVLVEKLLAAGERVREGCQTSYWWTSSAHGSRQTKGARRGEAGCHVGGGHKQMAAGQLEGWGKKKRKDRQLVAFAEEWFIEGDRVQSYMLTHQTFNTRQHCHLSWPCCPSCHCCHHFPCRPPVCAHSV